MTAHKKFLNELSNPVKKYERKMKVQQRKKVNIQQSEGVSTIDNDELMKELEAKLFDELFGFVDDDQTRLYSFSKTGSVILVFPVFVNWKLLGGIEGFPNTIHGAVPRKQIPFQISNENNEIWFGRAKER